MQENGIPKGTEKLPVHVGFYVIVKYEQQDIPGNNLLDYEDENYEIWALIVSNDIIYPTKCGIRRLTLNFGIKYYIAINF